MNKQSRMRADPITFEVIDFLLRAIASELETNLTRTSYSLMIYEYKDFAVGIVAADGQLICQGTGGLPIFLADIGAPLKSVLEAHPIETIRPGDAFVTNDPEASGQHLNNVTMYTPVFGDDEKDLIAFITVRAHWTDIGGGVFGSMMTSSSTDIYQEGVQFPALKFCNAGKDDDQILRMIAKNSRIPDITIGDLQAQLAACRLGEQRLKEMMSRYGWDTIKATIDERWVRSELLARKRIEQVPDGTYEAACWLDNDGIEMDRRLPFNFKVVIAKDEVTIDFTDVADQVKGPYNAGMVGGGITAAKVAYKYALIPDLHSDEGCFRPLKVILPPGKILSAGQGAPMARFNVIMATVIDGLINAFGKAVPENVAAAHHAAQNSIQFTGRRAGGTIWNYNDTAHGGWGASLGGDGSGPFKTMSHGDCKDIPVEIVEALYPIRIEEVSLRTDSAGAGRRRGGLGTVRRCMVLEDANLTVAWERTTCPPWGLFGGKSAEVGSVTLEAPEADPVSITKVTQMPVKKGTRVSFLTAGGGGCGDPLERPVEDVIRDVELGYVSRERALRDYGIGLTEDGKFDQASSSRKPASNSLTEDRSRR
jgi:N-methylhydantoinase B